MLDNGLANLRSSRDLMLPRATDAHQTFEAIRELYETRRLAQRVIALDFPLDDFVGILMVDRYDDEFVAVVDTLVTRFTSNDRELPPASAADLLREKVGELPPVQTAPAAYAITYIIGRCVTGARAVPRDADPALRADVEEVAVRLIGGLTQRYRLGRSGSAQRDADDNWHESVVERLRCAEHKSGYTTKELRNGLKPDGSLYRRYIVTCTTGGEDRRLDFDLAGTSVLSTSKGRQNLKGPLEKPESRQPGVDP
jgi:hypothetical protein